MNDSTPAVLFFHLWTPSTRSNPTTNKLSAPGRMYSRGLEEGGYKNEVKKKCQKNYA